MKLNTNYDNLESSYLFSTIAKKVNEYAAANPDKKIIRLGIGDVTKPLCRVVISALHKAVDDMGVQETFRGYGPEQGYDFLREAIQKYYKSYNVELDLNEIFISDGAKSDLGNILDLFDKDNVVLVPNPVYPVYVDTNIMAGRKVIYSNAGSENGFLPMPDENVKADIERYVTKTEGYTFDFVKEVVQGIYVDGISEVAIFDRLEELIKRNGKIKVTEDEAKRIGFTNSEDEDSMQNDCIDEPCTTTSTETRCNPRPILENRRNVKVVKGFG